jgi:hypothetical protein
MKAKWELSISIFTKQPTTVAWGCFSNAGEVKGKGDAVVGKGGQEFGVPTSSVKIQLPISTQEILASSSQLYLLVAGRSSALFCAFYILCGQ